MTNSRLPLAALLVMLALAGCGGGSSETAGKPANSDVGAKAVADVDAAMADAQRSRTAAPAAPAT